MQITPKQQAGFTQWQELKNLIKEIAQQEQKWPHRLIQLHEEEIASS